MLINLTQYPVPATVMAPEERDYICQLELEEVEQPLSRNEAFRLLEGRVFEAVWPDDEFPW